MTQCLYNCISNTTDLINSSSNLRTNLNNYLLLTQTETTHLSFASATFSRWGKNVQNTKWYFCLWLHCKSVKYLDPLMLFTKHNKEYKCFHSQTNSKISTSLVLNTNKSQNQSLFKISSCHYGIYIINRNNQFWCLLICRDFFFYLFQRSISLKFQTRQEKNDESLS